MVPPNLTGRKFGRLTVTGPCFRPKGATGKGTGVGFKAPVQCDCGNKESVFVFLLQRGRKKACENCLQPNATFR